MSKYQSWVFSVVTAATFVVSCKPKEHSPQPPLVTNAPVVAPAAPEVETTRIPKAPAAPKVLTPQEAKDHVGEVATVQGKVFGVHVSQKGDVFINIGAAHPNQPFTAVCFGGALPTEDLKKLDGKTVKVSGKIKDYNGQIEIVLERAEQISE